MKRFLVFAASFFLAFALLHRNASAQELEEDNSNYKKGYSLTVTIKHTKDSILYFGNYFANNQYAVDTAYLDKKGRFIFKNKDKVLFPGMYFFATPEGRYFEILIDQPNEYPNFQMETADEQFVRNMKITGSKVNQFFYDYSKFNQRIYEELDSLKKKAQLSDEEYAVKRSAYAESVDSQKVAFMKTHPQHFLTKILRATKEIEIPPAPRNEEGEIIDSLFQYHYYINHYFDNFPLDWDGLIRTPSPVFYDRLVRYFDQAMKYQPVDSIMHYADLLIEKSRPSKEMFRYLVWFLADKYLKSPVLGHDAVYVHLIEKYYKSGDAFWATPSSIEEEVKRAERMKNLLLGKTAPELLTKDMSGQFVSLYGIKAKFTLLIFWSPDCGHCRDEIPLFAQFYKEKKKLYDLEVYAVEAEFIEEKKWKEFCEKHELNWINTSGETANINWKEVYDVYKFPVVYLLDENKVIIGKQLSVETTEQIIQAVLEGKKMY